MFVFWTLLEMSYNTKKIPLAAEQALTFHSELGVSPCKICLSLNKFSGGYLGSVKPSVS